MTTTTRLDPTQLQQIGAFQEARGNRVTAGPGHPDDDRAWDGWLAGRPDAGILQLSGWGALKERFGWWRRLVLARDDSGAVCAGAQILLRSQYGVTLAYVPRGPVTDWRDASLTRQLLAAIRREARAAGAAILKLEPGLPDTPATRALLAGYGFAPSLQTIQPPSTVVVDLRGTEDEILGRMKSKWRYNVRLAERKGVTVRPLTRAELPVFDRLMATTGQRDGFAVHSPAYYAAAFDLLTPDHAVFLLAEYEREPLAVVVVALAGTTACYLWGASSDRERNRMPNHALQWAGMRWARARGATRYDFWGIPDELGQLAAAMAQGDGSGTPADHLPLDLERLPGAGLWGVYRFKQGFGGDVVRYAGAWDAALEPVGYGLYRQGLAAQSWLADAQRRVRALSVGQPPAPAEHAAPQPAGVRIIWDAGEWRNLLGELPEPHVLQSWEWGVLKGQTGWLAERLSLRAEAGAAAFQFLRRHPLPLVPVTIGYVPKGPVLDWNNLDLVDETLAQIEAHARRQGAIFVKIDPDVREDTPAGKLVLHTLQRRGWRRSGEQIQYKNTAYTDLAVGPDALLAGMKSKWRYNVNLAARRGVKVRAGGVEDLRAFYDLYLETGNRDGFLIRPFDYYRTTWTAFLQAQEEPGNPAGGALLLAEHPEETAPLAGLILLKYGRCAWYFYGASSERRRRDMPNYLLQWEALQWAAAQGCTTYDWWGAPTRPEDPADELQGVWQFKQGFGAELQPHIGAWDFVVNAARYRLYQEAVPAVLATWRRLAGR
jgi:lipid II:glycine glycyltransferase (peptidoglycan interpeptide bridge formation enzyme)